MALKEQLHALLKKVPTNFINHSLVTEPVRSSFFIGGGGGGGATSLQIFYAS